MPYASKFKKKLHQRKWQRERRRKAIQLLGGQCFDCCNVNRKLEFHHRDPEIKVSEVKWSWSWERILAEVDKCDLLCVRCHLKRTIPQAREQAMAMPRNETGAFMTVAA